MIKRKQDVPDATEFLFVVAAVPELPEETLHRLALPGLQITEVILHLPEFGDILEDMVSLNQILVYFREIA